MPEASTSSGGDAEQLRSLTRAVIAVSAGLDLDDLLQRLVSTAARFSGATYGALGISGPDGRIVTFVTHGISTRLREELGGMPGPHGVPGALLGADAATMRLSALQDHPRSVGFPVGHPPMRTFLGVPLRVQGRIFGNLYVAEKRTAAGEPALFTADDEEALLALGAAAGVAVENARLYAAVRHRQRWSDALGRANHAIIARSDRDARARLAPVPSIARAAAECDVAVLAFRAADGSWQVRYADAGDSGTGDTDAGDADAGDGATADAALVGLAVPAAICARAVPDAVVPLDDGDLAWLPGPWARGLLVPVGGGTGACEEALVLAYRSRTDPALGDPDTGSELEFGQRLGLALQVAQAQADSAALALLRDRDRIARDLHDHVIQRLFAIGLSLQAAGVAARVPEVQTRLDRAVDDIDETIKDVRRTIFELHATARRCTVREQVEQVVADVGQDVASRLELHVGGGLDGIPAALAPDLLAALREMLSNVARHAKATTVQVYLTTGRELELEVVDDGVGLPPGIPADGAGDGLTNLTERAVAHGGTFEISSEAGNGTIARWSTPLP